MAHGDEREEGMGKGSMRRRHLRLGGSDPAADVEDELAFHLETRVADLQAEGLTEEEARARARREFGDVDRIRRKMKEIGRGRARRERRARGWETLGQDLRYALRSAVRAPLFSLVAIGTLALGIGANTAVFSVLKSVLLDALPYAEPDRLVRVYGRFLDGTQERGPLSAGTVDDLRRRQTSFQAMGAFSPSRDVVFGGSERPQVVKAAWVEPAFFRTLDVSPAAGRTFTEEEGQTDTARVAVLSHEGWQRMLGDDPDALGREILLDDISRTVIGILPPGFVAVEGEVDVYFAMSLASVLADPISARRSHFLGLVGRRKPGVAPETAERELVGIAADLAREYPESTGGLGVSPMPLREAMLGDTRTPLLVLMLSAALVLLIACANLSGALLSRTIARRKEFAVRTALGAGRRRIVRQLLAESGLLGLAGGAAGVALATGGLAAVGGLAATALPDHADLSLDPGALLATLLLALATGLAFGLVPALSAGAGDPQSALREEGRGASESRRSGRMRGMLVAGQIALSLSLLAGAGLLARSLWAMTSAPAGFDARGVLTAAVQIPSGEYPEPEELRRFHAELTERLNAIPGVRSAAIASSVPTAVESWMGVTLEGQVRPDDEQPFVRFASVQDGYFETLRIPLLRGRTFDERDVADGPRKTVISQAMARRFWPDSDPLGERVRMGPDPSSPLIEVIGIVGDVRNEPASAEPEPMAYVSMRQFLWPAAVLVVRTEGDPLAFVRPVEAALAEINPRLPLDRAATLADVVGEKLAGRKLPVLLMTAFGALALILASVGVYAMFATMAAARRREFGIRIALGSRPGEIAGLVLRQGGGWMALGLLVGGGGVVLVARLVEHLLYRVAPFDPLTLGAAVALLLGFATVALLVPVSRATRVDPATALQAE